MHQVQNTGICLQCWFDSIFLPHVAHFTRCNCTGGNSVVSHVYSKKSALLQTHVTTDQKQIVDVKKLHEIPRAKDDFEERSDKATSIKAKTFKDVCDANNVLQVLADDEINAQLKQEVRDWLQNTKDILNEEKKMIAAAEVARETHKPRAKEGDDKLFAKFESLTPRVNETKHRHAVEIL